MKLYGQLPYNIAFVHFRMTCIIIMLLFLCISIIFFLYPKINYSKVTVQLALARQVFYGKKKHKPIFLTGLNWTNHSHMSKWHYYLFQTSIFHVHSMEWLRYAPAYDSFHRCGFSAPSNESPNCNRLDSLWKRTLL